MSGSHSEDVKISKRLSFVLRHKPDAVGLSLDTGGWVAIDLLLDRLAASGKPVSQAALERVVETCDKQRFAFSEDRKRIRANQGHSVSVDLQLPAQRPPDTLFHGTASRFLEAISREGLKPGSRLHVHLSVNPEIARLVGARHGTPIILLVDGAAMYRGGLEFFLSANGVWLTKHVPSRYLTAKSDN